MLGFLRLVVAAVIACCVFSVIPSVLAADEPAHPFARGEKLTFDLKWGRIGAGTAVLRVLHTQDLGGAQVYHFEVSARSQGMVEAIFKIRDRLESFVDTGMNHSLLYKQKIREGGYRKDRRITFDWEKNEVEYISDKREPRYIPVMPGTFDPIAAFYYVRTQLADGVSKIERPITDGSKNVVGRVNIIRREKVEVRNRTYDAYVLEPIMDEVEIFSSDKDSNIRIWVTADKRKLPVLITSKVTFGEFRAELRKVEHQPLLPPRRDQ